MPISQTESYFQNPQYGFLEEPMLLLLALKWKKSFPVLRQELTQTLP